MNKRMTVKEMTMCAMFTVLIALGAFIRIPIPIVPFTLQTFFTLMAGVILGSRLGAMSAGLYAVLGLAGLPIFAEGGGIWYVAKPSFGYILGFIAGTYATGLMIEKMKNFKFAPVFFANITGLMVIYVIGMIYYFVVANYFIHSPIGVGALFLHCFLLTVPGDICLCVLSAFLAGRLRPIILK